MGVERTASGVVLRTDMICNREPKLSPSLLEGRTVFYSSSFAGTQIVRYREAGAVNLRNIPTMNFDIDLALTTCLRTSFVVPST